MCCLFVLLFCYSVIFRATPAAATKEAVSSNTINREREKEKKQLLFQVIIIIIISIYYANLA